MTERVAIVTGASSGIGKAISARLAQDGWQVYPTMRAPGADAPANSLALDVTDDDSVNRCVDTVWQRSGRIDALINNAGITLMGAAEETSDAEALAIFNTNFFGVHRMVRAVLPHMRARHDGRIITIGSIAGFLPKPFEAFYSAAKHALEGYVESLDHEVRQFGIRALLIEPGFVRSSLGANTTATALNLAAYAHLRERAHALLNADIAGGIQPADVAQAVATALETRSPSMRTRVGADAARLHLARHYLPASLFDRGVRSRFGLLN